MIPEPAHHPMDGQETERRPREIWAYLIFIVNAIATGPPGVCVATNPPGGGIGVANGLGTL